MPKRIRIACWILIGITAGYVFSVGAVPSIERHTGDSGRLQWLPSIPGAITVLDAYQWPARQLSRLPVLDCVFEFSASVWWELLSPTDTTA
jgi:hypothetical protein